MCNLYSLSKGQAAIIEMTRAMLDQTGNMPLLPGIFPDYSAPIVRNSGQGRALAMSEVIQREVGAGGKQTRHVAIQNQSGLIAHAEPLEKLLQISHGRKLVRNAVADRGQFVPGHKACSGNMTCVVGLPLFGNVQHHDL